MTTISGGGGGGGGMKLLPLDAVFRIEVSLSSRKSSAIVMRTTARLYSLEGSKKTAGGSGDAEWKSVAYGAPCLQLMKQSTGLNSPFHIKLVIAEVESGISLWESEIDPSCKYHAMQTNFHTFAVDEHTFAVQFASEDEAGRMLESIQDLFLQREKADTVSFERKSSDDAIFKKPKPFARRLSKKDISAPCNFKHVSGITVQRTATCEEELRGTIQRKMRSLSLSNLRTKPRSKLPGDMVDGSVYMDESPEMQRKGDKDGGKKRHKFSSLRITGGKKKKYTTGVTVTELAEYHGNENFTRNETRMSLPSHFRHQTRPQLSSDLFQQQQQQPGGPRAGPPGPNRALSLSSGHLVDLSTGAPRPAAPLERRHTYIDQHTRRPVSQFQYTPYSQGKSNRAGVQPQSIDQQSSRQYVSDMSLNQMPVRYRGLERHPQQMVDSRKISADEVFQRGGRWVHRRSLTEAQFEGSVPMEGMMIPPQTRLQGVQNGSIPQSGRKMVPSKSTGDIVEEWPMGTQPPPVTTIPPGSIPYPRMPPHSHVGDSRGAPSDATHARAQHNGSIPQNVPPTTTANMPLPTSIDPQPYATVGFKTKAKKSSSKVPPPKSQPSSKVPPPSEGPQVPPDAHYDLLNPRNPKNRALPPTPIQVPIPQPYKKSYPPQGDTRIQGQYPIQSDTRMQAQYPPQGDTRMQAQYPPQGDARMQAQYPPQGDARMQAQYPPRGDARMQGQYPIQGDARMQGQYPIQGDTRVQGQYPIQGDARMQAQYPPHGQQGYPRLHAPHGQQGDPRMHAPHGQQGDPRLHGQGQLHHTRAPVPQGYGQPHPQVSQYQPQMSQYQPQVSQPHPQMSQYQPQVSQSQPQVSQPQFLRQQFPGGMPPSSMPSSHAPGHISRSRHPPMEHEVSRLQQQVPHPSHSRAQGHRYVPNPSASSYVPTTYPQDNTHQYRDESQVSPSHLMTQVTPVPSSQGPQHSFEQIPVHHQQKVVVPTSYSNGPVDVPQNSQQKWPMDPALTHMPPQPQGPPRSHHQGSHPIGHPQPMQGSPPPIHRSHLPMQGSPPTHRSHLPMQGSPPTHRSHLPMQGSPPTHRSHLPMQGSPPTQRSYQHQSYSHAPPPTQHSHVHPPTAGPGEREDSRTHYDILTPRAAALRDEAGNRDSTASHGSVPGEAQQYTEQMTRALEQFDTLLAPQSKRQIMQTSL